MLLVKVSGITTEKIEAFSPLFSEEWTIPFSYGSASHYEIQVKDKKQFYSALIFSTFYVNMSPHSWFKFYKIAIYSMNTYYIISQVLIW